jgi:hypothetical protein
VRSLRGRHSNNFRARDDAAVRVGDGTGKMSWLWNRRGGLFPESICVEHCQDEHYDERFCDTHDEIDHSSIKVPISYPESAAARLCLSSDFLNSAAPLVRLR